MPTNNPTEKILRVNPDQLHGIPYTSDAATMRVRGKSKFAKRERPVNEATPPITNIWTTDIYDGAELRPYQGRPGALDFLKCPSKGLAP